MDKKAVQATTYNDQLYGVPYGIEALGLYRNTEVAPECRTLAADDFIPPGGTYSDEVEETGTERYQCCIHPWMRATVTARR